MILFLILFLINPINKNFFESEKDGFCPCRLLETKKYWSDCAFELMQIPENPYGIDHAITTSISFDKNGTQMCNYFQYYDNTIYALCLPYLSDQLFIETREECKPIWEFNKASGIYFDSSVTISFDGKYIIPYCYGLKNLYVYEIETLYYSFMKLKKVLSITDKVEAVRFFEDYLIVLNSKKIIAYSMKKGREFKKIAEFFLAHRLYTPDEVYPNAKIPTLMRNMEMDGDYLYILNPPGNDLGPLLTFKIDDEKIELINDGSEFKATFNDYEYIWRRNLELNEAHNKKYIRFQEFACDYNNKHRIPLFRIENHIPIPIDKHFYERSDFEGCLYGLSGFTVFKNEFSYGFHPWGEMCSNAIFYFTEDEEFVRPIIGEQVYKGHIWEYGMYKGPDTELLNFYGRSVSCSTDDLPTIEYLIKPEEASRNFLIMGKAYDSEGIRRVFVGACLQKRAQIFQQEDGSVLFMSIILEGDLRRCNPNSSSNNFYYIAIAEDWDGDTNNSPDASLTRDWVNISFKEEKDPLPIGEVEICPYEYAKSIYINGWALDNNGIKGGWLFSEDANILIPINYGKERQDIKDKYPEYPDSLHSGFEVQYDLSNLEEGKYEFYVRIMAKDYQVIDFGPYKITIPKHKRPF